MGRLNSTKEVKKTLQWICLFLVHKKSLYHLKVLETVMETTNLNVCDGLLNFSFNFGVKIIEI